MVATTGGTTSSTASRERLSAGPGRLGAHALPALHLGHDRQAEGHPAHDRRLPPRDLVQPRDGLRHQAGRRLLVRRRHRLGHRPQLHRLRATRQRDDRRHVRGRAGHPGLGSLVADHRGLQGLDPVLRPDRHPGLHEAGRGLPGGPRPDLACACSGSVGEPINPEAWLWYREHIGGNTDAHRRYVVADRDRPDHDHATPRRDRHETGECHVPVPGHRRGRHRRRRQLGPERQRRLPRPEAAVAGHAARHLRRPGAVQGDVLEPVPGDVLRGRRRQEGPRRLPLAARPRRRRHERGGSPDLARPRSNPRSSTTSPSPSPRSSARRTT